jgi:hypothetical protein
MPKKQTRRPQVRHMTDKKRCERGHSYATHGLVVKDGILPSGKQKWRLECRLCRREYNRKYFYRRAA